MKNITSLLIVLCASLVCVSAQAELRHSPGVGVEAPSQSQIQLEVKALPQVSSLIGAEDLIKAFDAKQPKSVTDMKMELQHGMCFACFAGICKWRACGGIE